MKTFDSAENNPKFKLGDIVKHMNGTRYNICLGVDPLVRLEYCDQPFYAYAELNSSKVWLRAQSIMEDGRFEKVA